MLRPCNPEGPAHSDWWSKVSVALLVVWRWTGYNMVLMLAGLQGIPAESYEAAAVDGAGRLRQVWDVTLPLMRPTFAFCLILAGILVSEWGQTSLDQTVNIEGG